MATYGNVPAHITAANPGPRLFMSEARVGTHTLHRVKTMVDSASADLAEAVVDEIRNGLPDFHSRYKTQRVRYAIANKLMTLINNAICFNDKENAKGRWLNFGKGPDACLRNMYYSYKGEWKSPRDIPATSVSTFGLHHSRACYKIYSLRDLFFLPPAVWIQPEMPLGEWTWFLEDSRSLHDEVDLGAAPPPVSP